MASAQDLLPTLAEAAILVSTDARRAAVIEQATVLAATVGGTIDFDSEAALVDEITNLVEEPHAILGRFDARYLDLPEQILTTVMRKHQRYLQLFDADGRLIPYFVTVANGLVDDEMVARGNESVVRARFEDALFFWDADLRVETVDEFVPGLEKLVFEEKLGSVGKRARRIAEGADALASRLGVTDAELTTLRRAGNLESTWRPNWSSTCRRWRGSRHPVRAPARDRGGAPGRTSTRARRPARCRRRRRVRCWPSPTAPTCWLACSVGRPTGSSDPFGLRRAALELVRILREVPAVAR